MKRIVLIGLAAVALLAWGYWARWGEPAIKQPIEFPHKAHLELKDPKLECTSAGCHERAEKDIVAAKIECQTCHGPMETLDRPPPRALKKLTMDDCMNCHETWRWPAEEAEAGLRKMAMARKISNDCGACHR